jgi:hypothetical protein
MGDADQDFWRLVAQARDPERPFPVRSNKWRHFYAGQLADGMPALIGRTLAETILVLVFSQRGELYDVQRRDLPKLHERPEIPYGSVNDHEFHGYLLNEFGFRAGMVRVHGFSVSDHRCGFWLGPLPWHVNIALAEMDKYPPEEQVHQKDGIRQFIERGVCVLDWANDWSVLEADGMEAGWERYDSPPSADSR